MNKHPLQSKQWASFREKWGNEVVQTPYGNITLHKLPFVNFKIGNFSKGPKPTKEMIDWLKTYSQQNNIFFIKFEPNVQKTKKLTAELKKWGLIPGKTLFTPTTFWIDITPSEEDLLKSFSQKTRYNIKVAQKHGVTINEETNETGFKEFLKLHFETTERQGFYSHTQKYHKLLWEELKQSDIPHILLAKYKGEVITAWLLFAYDNFLYYPYGGSSDKYKNVMANNLMMWEAIKLGKKHNLTTFDLWGREEGKGFTKFKEGYNPKVIEFIGTWDLVVNKPIYWLYRVAEILRWKILRLKAKLTK
jgi:lipid II:glycine glycyltransferase (peptidoglycan interpeptide bridge formation enzyme)